MGRNVRKSKRPLPYLQFHILFNRLANGNTGRKRCANGDTGKFIKKQEAYIVANSKYNKRRWSVPSKRAKGYAADRKAKVHTYGPKEGKELTDFEAGIRSGYLQAQSDHAECTSTRRRSMKASPRKRPARSRRPKAGNNKNYGGIKGKWKTRTTKSSFMCRRNRSNITAKLTTITISRVLCVAER